MLTLPEYADRVAASLKASATCACLMPAEWDPHELFRQIKAITPVVGILSDTGRTLHLGVVTENPQRFGNNDRLNLQSHMTIVRRAAANHPERVLT